MGSLQKFNENKGIDLCKNLEQLPKLIKKARDSNYKRSGRKKYLTLK